MSGGPPYEDPYPWTPELKGPDDPLSRYRSTSFGLFAPPVLPPSANFAIARCEAAAERCRTAYDHASLAADDVLVGWSGTARDRFVEVAGDNLEAVHLLAVKFDQMADQIRADAIAVVGAETRRHDAYIRRHYEPGR